MYQLTLYRDGHAPRTLTTPKGLTHVFHTRVAAYKHGAKLRKILGKDKKGKPRVSAFSVHPYGS